MIDIKDKKDCCGCASCVQACPKHCISFDEDEEGFRYPLVNKEVCIDCHLCEKACPVLNPSEPRTAMKVYAALNTDEEVRMNSSSGGVFSLLADKVLAEGGVVFGAEYDENWEVRHGYAETKDELGKLRSSKYVQSRIEDNFSKAKEFLKQGRKVLFVGTSCQIAGLKRYLGKDYDQLLTVDIICHGVPSPMMWRDYLNEIKDSVLASSQFHHTAGCSHRIISQINFREKKRTGWKKYSFSVTTSDPDSAHAPQESISLLVRENPYMRIFLSDIALRYSCYACPAKNGKSCSDITLGDYWGIARQHPEMDDDKGTCLVIATTMKGNVALHLPGLKKIEVSLEDGIRYNPSYQSATPKPDLRDSFFKEYLERENTISELCSKLVPAPAKKTIWCVYMNWIKRGMKKMWFSSGNPYHSLVIIFLLTWFCS